MNLDAMVKWGTIDVGDLDLIRFVNNPDEAFQYLSDRWRVRSLSLP